MNKWACIAITAGVLSIFVGISVSIYWEEQTKQHAMEYGYEEVLDSSHGATHRLWKKSNVDPVTQKEIKS